MNIWGNGGTERSGHLVSPCPPRLKSPSGPGTKQNTHHIAAADLLNLLLWFRVSWRRHRRFCQRPSWETFSSWSLCVCRKLSSSAVSLKHLWCHRHCCDSSLLNKTDSLLLELVAHLFLFAELFVSNTLSTAAAAVDQTAATQTVLSDLSDFMICFLTQASAAKLCVFTAHFTQHITKLLPIRLHSATKHCICNK